MNTIAGPETMFFRALITLLNYHTVYFTFGLIELLQVECWVTGWETIAILHLSNINVVQGCQHKYILKGVEGTKNVYSKIIIKIIQHHLKGIIQPI